MIKLLSICTLTTLCSVVSAGISAGMAMQCDADVLNQAVDIAVYYLNEKLKDLRLPDKTFFFLGPYHITDIHFNNIQFKAEDIRFSITNDRNKPWRLHLDVKALGGSVHAHSSHPILWSPSEEMDININVDYGGIFASIDF